MIQKTVFSQPSFTDYEVSLFLMLVSVKGKLNFLFFDREQYAQGPCFSYHEQRSL